MEDKNCTEANSQSGIGFLGTIVALQAVDLAVHDVLEAVGPGGSGVPGVPLPVVRVAVLPQGGG